MGMMQQIREDEDGTLDEPRGRTVQFAPFMEDSAFRAIFEAAPYGIILVDDSGVIILTNARLDTKFGYPVGSLVGRQLEVLLPQRHRVEHRGLRAGYVQAPTQRTMGAGRDLTGRRRNGVEFPVEVGLCTIDTPEGRLTCASVVDITTRKSVENRLRETNAQLEEFTYVTSHDLRSPLRGVSNLIEFVREDLGDEAPPAVVRNLDRMTTRIGQLERLMDDLLAYARASRRTAGRDVIDLRAIMTTIIDLQQAGDEVLFHLDLPEETFVGAATPLATVLRNLIANAIRHHDRTHKEVSVAAHFEPEFCVIDVSDDGPGIPETAQERIFRLFQTLDTKTVGENGLGLAVVQRLVDGHGGSISVHSHDGERGSCFRICWPRFVRSDLDD
jgi:PAS domain S-box-containing protein